MVEYKAARTVQKNPNNTHNTPPVLLEATRFYLRFQTRHATFVQAAGQNLITFHEATIAALGGGAFGHGVPQTLGDEERVYPGAGVTGWIEDDVFA